MEDTPPPYVANESIRMEQLNEDQSRSTVSSVGGGDNFEIAGGGVDEFHVANVVEVSPDVVEPPVFESVEMVQSVDPPVVVVEQSVDPPVVVAVEQSVQPVVEAPVPVPPLAIGDVQSNNNSNSNSVSGRSSSSSGGYSDSSSSIDSDVDDRTIKVPEVVVSPRRDYWDFSAGNAAVAGAPPPPPQSMNRAKRGWKVLRKSVVSEPATATAANNSGGLLSWFGNFMTSPQAATQENDDELFEPDAQSERSAPPGYDDVLVQVDMNEADRVDAQYHQSVAIDHMAAERQKEVEAEEENRRAAELQAQVNDALVLERLQQRKEQEARMIARQTNEWRRQNEERIWTRADQIEYLQTQQQEVVPVLHHLLNEVDAIVSAEQREERAAVEATRQVFECVRDLVGDVCDEHKQARPRKNSFRHKNYVHMCDINDPKHLDSSGDEDEDNELSPLVRVRTVASARKQLNANDDGPPAYSDLEDAANESVSDVSSGRRSSVRKRHRRAASSNFSLHMFKLDVPQMLHAAHLAWEEGAVSSGDVGRSYADEMVQHLLDAKYDYDTVATEVLVGGAMSSEMIPSLDSEFVELVDAWEMVLPSAVIKTSYFLEFLQGVMQDLISDNAFEGDLRQLDTVLVCMVEALTELPGQVEVFGAMEEMLGIVEVMDTLTSSAERAYAQHLEDERTAKEAVLECRDLVACIEDMLQVTEALNPKLRLPLPEMYRSGGGGGKTQEESTAEPSSDSDHVDTVMQDDASAIVNDEALLNSPVVVSPSTSGFSPEKLSAEPSPLRLPPTIAEVPTQSPPATMVQTGNVGVGVGVGGAKDNVSMRFQRSLDEYQYEDEDRRDDGDNEDESDDEYNEDYDDDDDDGGDGDDDAGGLKSLRREGMSSKTFEEATRAFVQPAWRVFPDDIICPVNPHMISGPMEPAPPLTEDQLSVTESDADEDLDTGMLDEASLRSGIRNLMSVSDVFHVLGLQPEWADNIEAQGISLLGLYEMSKADMKHMVPDKRKRQKLKSYLITHKEEFEYIQRMNAAPEQNAVPELTELPDSLEEVLFMLNMPSDIVTAFDTDGLQMYQLLSVSKQRLERLVPNEALRVRITSFISMNASLLKRNAKELERRGIQQRQLNRIHTHREYREWNTLMVHERSIVRRAKPVLDVWGWESEQERMARVTDHAIDHKPKRARIDPDRFVDQEKMITNEQWDGALRACERGHSSLSEIEYVTNDVTEQMRTGIITSYHHWKDAMDSHKKRRWNDPRPGERGFLISATHALDTLATTGTTAASSTDDGSSVSSAEGEGGVVKAGTRTKPIRAKSLTATRSRSRGCVNTDQECAIM